MQETLNSKKKGDAAFRHKDFKTAIDSYTMVSNSWLLVILKSVTQLDFWFSYFHNFMNFVPLSSFFFFVDLIPTILTVFGPSVNLISNI